MKKVTELISMTKQTAFSAAAFSVKWYQKLSAKFDKKLLQTCIGIDKYFWICGPNTTPTPSAARLMRACGCLVYQCYQKMKNIITIKSKINQLITNIPHLRSLRRPLYKSFHNFYSNHQHESVPPDILSKKKCNESVSFFLRACNFLWARVIFYERV